MQKHYSITEAHHNLVAILAELEREECITLTRGGEPVAVLVSIAEYRRLAAGRPTFLEAYRAFRDRFTRAEGEVEAFLRDSRDTTHRRESEQ